VQALTTFGHLTSPKAILPVAWLTPVLARSRERGTEVALATTLAVVVADALKAVIDRHRPRVFTSGPWNSFPSGHSTASTAYFLGLALLAEPRHRAAALGTAALAATAVNVLRVVARQHWPTDVLAGDAIGVASVGTVRLASRALRRRRRSAS
jgi:undecaprenyl-diphosphatase